MKKHTIYHITHISNISRILLEGGLHCDNFIENERLGHQDIAYSRIKEKRRNFKVPIEPYGVVADYVPFYFCRRSPMLFALHKGSVEGYKGGQDPIVHIVGYVEDIVEASLPFVFTDGQAVMKLSEYFCSIEDLNKLNWEIIKSWDWGDSEEEPDRKRRKQAEFLVHNFYPISQIKGIGVIDDNVRKELEALILKSGQNIPVKVFSDWYYEE